jgi:hypothetical protein
VNGPPLPAALDCRSNTELFHRASPLLITIRRSQVRHTVDLKIAVGDWGRFPMKTAAEYRAMAEECFKWAHETHDNAVREGYLKLAQVWLDAASQHDGLPAIRIAPAPDNPSKKSERVPPRSSAD